MKELLNTLLETSKERIKNPFLGAFLFSFTAFNWKPIFILIFASNNIQEKIKIIERDYTGALYNLWLPVAFAIFYILVLPYIMWFIDKASTLAIKGRKENILEQKLFDLKTKQTIALQESKLEDIRANFRETKDLNSKIEILTTQIEERDNNLSILQNQIDNISKEKKQLQMFMVDQNVLSEDKIKKYEEEYESFKNSNLYKYFKNVGINIRKNNSVPYTIDQVIIEKFILSDIIIKSYDEETGNSLFNLTPKGEFYWKKFILNLDIKPPEVAPDLNSELPF